MLQAITDRQSSHHFSPSLLTNAYVDSSEANLLCMLTRTGAEGTKRPIELTKRVFGMNQSTYEAQIWETFWQA